MPNWFNRTLKLPKVHHSNFDMSNDWKTSFKIGELLPVNLEECLPSDKFLKIRQEVFLRFAPLLFPIMHNIKVHTSNFFVPIRIILGDDLYKDFLNNNVNLSSIILHYDNDAEEDTNPFENSIWDYLGYDVQAASYDGTQLIPEWTLTLFNPIPYLSYLTIIRDWYLDSNIQSSDIESIDTIIDNYRIVCAAGYDYDADAVVEGKPYLGKCFIVSYGKDYFSTARPQPELGSEMYVLNRPLIFGQNQNIGSFVYPRNSEGPVSVIDGTFTDDDSTKFGVSISNNNLNNAGLTESTTIRDLWRKEMLQQYYQIDNKFGNRVREKLAGHFGVIISDSRIQIPRYLGGSSSTVQISEVVQTSASTDDSPQGNYTGKATSFHRTKSVHYFCEEHGYFLTLLSLIPENGYCNGMPRTMFKKNIFDFASPEFNNIGWQEIYEGEIGSTTSKNAWGYQPRYSEYRSHPSRCVADFRRSPFLGWHLNRNFEGVPSLNSDFLKVSDTTRIFSSDNLYGVENPIYCDVFNDVEMSRPISYEPDSMHLY